MGEDDKHAAVAKLAERYSSQSGSLLPLLHAIQEELGHIDGRTVALVAEALNLSRAEVHGVVSFYHDFRTRPAGRHVVKVCRAESCQARGGVAVESLLADRLGVRMGETSGDGAVTLEPVFCLGLCAIGPNALVDGRPVARIDADEVERIAAEFAA